MSSYNKTIIKIIGIFLVLISFWFFISLIFLFILGLFLNIEITFINTLLLFLIVIIIRVFFPRFIFKD